MTREREWSQAVEDYVKAIYLLQEAGSAPTGQAVAKRLGVSQASVTSMVRRLDELGLATYRRYHAVELTQRGRLLALEVVRHHRLLELFLSETLGMSWDRIHAEAEVLEHHISEELEALICARLGNPQFDPHGHPIPALDGTVPEAATRPLAGLAAGACATIRLVHDDDPAVLRYLAEQGLVIGARVRVAASTPLAGTITVAVGEAQRTGVDTHAGGADGADGDETSDPARERTIGSELARRIHVG
jgi:DtxR family Mn-dependent transcriptional regulator